MDLDDRQPDWAKVTSYRDDGRVVVTRLVVFDASGKELLRTRPEQDARGIAVSAYGRAIGSGLEPTSAAWPTQHGQEL